VYKCRQDLCSTIGILFRWLVGMFIFTEEVMSNRGIRIYVRGKIYDDSYEGTSSCRKLYINK
jgi:hypothetical protein